MNRRSPIVIRMRSQGALTKTFEAAGRVDVFAQGHDAGMVGTTLQLFAIPDDGARALVRTGCVRGLAGHVALSYQGNHERYELAITPPDRELPGGTTARLTLVCVETGQPGADTQTLPAYNAQPVTPSDTTEVRYTSLFVGTGGTLQLDMLGAGTITLTNIADGTVLKELAVSRVYATGTTASGIVGFYE